MNQAERFVLTIDRYSCPKCKAKRGYRCIYLHGYKEGRPTKQPHWERLNKLHQEEARRWNEEWQRRRDEKLGHTPERVAVLRANAQQLLREHEAMRLWLRRYSWVLTRIN